MWSNTVACGCRVRPTPIRARCHMSILICCHGKCHRLGHVECVQLLLKFGGDPTQPDEYDSAPQPRDISGSMTPMYVMYTTCMRGVARCRSFPPPSPFIPLYHNYNGSMIKRASLVCDAIVMKLLQVVIQTCCRYYINK
jgi:hypothetical protein